MEFAKLLEDGRLWAVQYDEESINCFEKLFSQWYDMSWLLSFFKANLSDLRSFFRVTNVYQALMETIDEAKRLECLMLDLTPDPNLDLLSKHLDTNE